MSYQAIKDLVGYALRTRLIDEYDRPWAVNKLLKAMGMDAWEEPAETHERPLEDILKELLDDAAARGRIEDDTTNRDLFDTELMGRLTPRPSQVYRTFSEQYTGGGIKLARRTLRTGFTVSVRTRTTSGAIASPRM